MFILAKSNFLVNQDIKMRKSKQGWLFDSEIALNIILANSQPNSLNLPVDVRDVLADALDAADDDVVKVAADLLLTWLLILGS